MKLFFGICSLLIVTIGVQGASKIEIYEIRDNDNGLKIKNLISNPKNNQKPDPLLKLLRDPKPEKNGKKVVKFAKNLIHKLRSLRGEEKTNKFNDDTHIYILNDDDLAGDSSYEETLFIDKTRNDRATTNINNKNDLRNLLLQLFPTQKKRKLRQKRVIKLRKPLRVLRIADVDVLGESRTRPKYAYKYDEGENGQNNIDKDDQFNVDTVV